MSDNTREATTRAETLDAKHLELHVKWSDILSTALEAANSEGLPADSVISKDLAWAIAWLLEESVREDSPMAKSLEHLQGVVAASDWNGLLAILTRPLGQSMHRPRKTMPLQELAWSVGCERRLDWRPAPPHSPRGDEEESEPKDWDSIRAVASGKAFTKLNELENGVVTSGCRKWSHSDPEDLADRAWAAAYTTYWSVEARRRWAGNARVSTLILGVAKKLSLSDHARRGHTGVERDAETLELPKQKHSLGDLAESIERDVERVASPKQLEVLGLLVERGLSQQQAARVLGVSEAAISQALNRLAERLGPLGYGTRTGRRGGA